MFSSRRFRTPPPSISLIVAGLAVAGVVAGAALLIFWQGGGPTGDPAFEVGNAPFTPILAANRMVVGRNRVPIILLARDGYLIIDGSLEARLVGPDGKVRGVFPFEHVSFGSPLDGVVEHRHPDGTLHEHPDGFWVAQLDFDAGGTWEARYTRRPLAGATESVTFRFTVHARSAELAVGQRVPSVDSPVAPGPALGEVTTDPDPDPAFYQKTIAGALTEAKPLVVVFATPAFCQTRTCGPTLAVVKELRKRYPEFNYVHVELWDTTSNPNSSRPQPAAFKAFGLETEPWVYVADASGIVVARFEGTATATELEQVMGAIRPR